METKIVTKILYGIVILLSCNLHSQSKEKDTIYFLIDKKDTLIKEHIVTGQNSYKGYDIFYDEQKLVKKNKTPVVEGQVWIEDSKYDYYVYEPNYLVFSFFQSDGNLISKKYLNSLSIVTNRIEFLKTEKLLFNFSIFFIEPTDSDDNFIIREVYPVLYE